MIRCDHLIRGKQMIKCSKSEVRRLKTALRWKKLPPAQRERIQMVLMRESGMTQPGIAEVMGVSLSTVNRVHMAYDSGGVKALKPKPSGGRQRENMSVARQSGWDWRDNLDGTRRPREVIIYGGRLVGKDFD